VGFLRGYILASLLIIKTFQARVLTSPDFLEGMYAEAGAEAIDVQHHAVLELVKEINKGKRGGTPFRQRI